MLFDAGLDLEKYFPQYLDTLLLSTQCGFHIEDMSFTLISVSDSNDAGYWSSRPAVWQS